MNSSTSSGLTSVPVARVIWPVVSNRTRSAARKACCSLFRLAASSSTRGPCGGSAFPTAALHARWPAFAEGCRAGLWGPLTRWWHILPVLDAQPQTTTRCIGKGHAILGDFVPVCRLAGHRPQGGAATPAASCRGDGVSFMFGSPHIHISVAVDEHRHDRYYPGLSNPIPIRAEACIQR